MVVLQEAFAAFRSNFKSAAQRGERGLEHSPGTLTPIVLAINDASASI